jgi:large subunit ribosomal protein L21
MYAIIEDSGTQFKVSTGDTIRIDRKVGEDEKTVTFDRVLVVGGEGQPKLGAPIPGATVTADVVRAVKGPKVISVKHKRRKGYYKRTGHRQKYTAVKISAINA